MNKHNKYGYKVCYRETIYKNVFQINKKDDTLIIVFKEDYVNATATFDTEEIISIQII